MTEKEITIERKHFSLLNKARARFGLAQRINSFELYDQATDEGSVTQYGETQEDVIPFYFIRGRRMMNSAYSPSSLSK